MDIDQAIVWLYGIKGQFHSHAQALLSYFDRQDKELRSLRKRCERQRRDITELQRLRQAEDGTGGDNLRLRCEIKHYQDVIDGIHAVLFGGDLPLSVKDNMAVLHVKERAENIIAKSEQFMRERDKARADLGRERRKFTVRLSDGPCVGLIVQVPEDAVMHEIEYQHGNLTTKYTYTKSDTPGEWDYLNTEESGDGVTWQ